MDQPSLKLWRAGTDGRR